MPEEGGGGPNFLQSMADKTTGAMKNKANQLYGKGKVQVESLLGTRPGGAESAGFLRGNVGESLYDMTVGGIGLNVKHRLSRVFDQTGRAVENTALQTKKSLFSTPLTQPIDLIKNSIMTPIVAVNEAADLAATVAGSGITGAHEAYEGIIGRPVDRLAAEIKDKIGYIPVVGGIVGGLGAGTLNLANRLVSTPFKVAEVIRQKVGAVSDKYVFDKIRGVTMNEGAPNTVEASGTPSGNTGGGADVIDFAAEKAKRQGGAGAAGAGGMAAAA
jgi:hypothetical protein